MTLFDLLFMAAFLAAFVTLLAAAVSLLRGRGARALRILQRLAVCAAAYFALVIITSILLPRTILQIGEPRCFDDWCIAAVSAQRLPDSAGMYRITFRLSSTARGISQREKNVVAYLIGPSARRYDPLPDPSAVPFSVKLGPQEAVTATRVYSVPEDVHDLALVIAHEGGFPIDWLIAGYETWFRKPTLVRLS